MARSWASAGGPLRYRRQGELPGQHQVEGPGRRGTGWAAWRTNKGSRIPRVTLCWPNIENQGNWQNQRTASRSERGQMARHTQRRLAVVSGEGGGSRTTEDDVAKGEKGKRGEMGGS